MNRKNQLLVMIALMFGITFGLLGCSGGSSVPNEATVTLDPMDIVQRAATQTAAAALSTPTSLGVLPPGATYWQPPQTEHFTPRFIYASTRWALQDADTLVNLQVSDCTLSQSLSTDHGPGPGWTTEQSTLQAGEISFLTILAKYEGAPRFMTYYAPNGTTFEITSLSNFAQCAQDGENILKSLSLN